MKANFFCKTLATLKMFKYKLSSINRIYFFITTLIFTFVFVQVYCHFTKTAKSTSVFVHLQLYFGIYGQRRKDQDFEV